MCAACKPLCVLCSTDSCETASRFINHAVNCTCLLLTNIISKPENVYKCAVSVSVCVCGVAADGQWCAREMCFSIFNAFIIIIAIPSICVLCVRRVRQEAEGKKRKKEEEAEKKNTKRAKSPK